MSMVEKNTQTLLALHATLTKVMTLQNPSRINLPILEFENPFGHKMALPYQMCDSWNVRRPYLSSLLGHVAKYLS